MKHTILMIRVWETAIEVEADDKHHALEIASRHPDRYVLELEQCAITGERYVHQDDAE